MRKTTPDINSFKKLLTNFQFHENGIENTHLNNPQKTIVEPVTIGKTKLNRYINEFWTARQRQANPIHEISYRACFKPQLPEFFIKHLTQPGDYVYDPFSGRGTTIIEATLNQRYGVANDINPLSKMLAKPRLHIPSKAQIKERLENIPFNAKLKSDIDLSMFYEKKTWQEILSLRHYLKTRRQNNTEDFIDEWIRMVATNRLTGHSTNFFSVYTLPPNQAVTAEKQKKINILRNQKPVYKDVKFIILKKSGDLIKLLPAQTTQTLNKHGAKAIFVNKDARYTDSIKNNTIQLTVTSPPFLDIVQYAADNWLRCWFNDIDVKEVAGNITMSKTVEQWATVMQGVFKQLYRITKLGGWVAFEVGEVRNGKIRLDEYVVPLGINEGFTCAGILINQQEFTKTANIWGVSNNSKGTNSNRIVIFRKE